MEIKDISRDRLEQIAQTLIDRVHEFESWSNLFAQVLGWDGISLEEAKAFGYTIDDEYDIVAHKICYSFENFGTFHLHFYNEKTGIADVTEFYAGNEDELLDFWHDFCSQNDFEVSCLTNVECICKEQI